MEFIKLIIGIVMVIGYVWLFVKNCNRTGFINTLFYFDIIIGIGAGLYLIVTSIITGMT